MTKELMLFLAIVFIVALVSIFASKRYKRDETVLNIWAKENKYSILEQRAPYFWEALHYKGSKFQPRFIIKVQDINHKIKKGEVIFGTAWQFDYKKTNTVKSSVVWHKRNT